MASDRGTLHHIAADHPLAERDDAGTVAGYRETPLAPPTLMEPTAMYAVTAPTKRPEAGREAGLSGHRQARQQRSTLVDLDGTTVVSCQPAMWINFITPGATLAPAP